MPMVITIRSDGKLEAYAERMSKSPAWLPRQIDLALSALGPTLMSRMRTALMANRYTGGLEESVRADYDRGAKRLTVGPTKKTADGKWDRGMILELGTRPIPRAPWTPIRLWANFRGLPAFPVWWKIRTKGVAAHPFLDRTLAASEADIRAMTEHLVDVLARTAVGEVTP